MKSRSSNLARPRRFSLRLSIGRSAYHRPQLQRHHATQQYRHPVKALLAFGIGTRPISSLSSDVRAVAPFAFTAIGVSFVAVSSVWQALHLLPYLSSYDSYRFASVTDWQHSTNVAYCNNSVKLYYRCNGSVCTDNKLEFTGAFQLARFPVHLHRTRLARYSFPFCPRCSAFARTFGNRKGNL